MLDYCEICGKKDSFYGLYGYGKLIQEIVKGVHGTFCEECFNNAPSFCKICWDWTIYYDCENHDTWYECPACNASFTSEGGIMEYFEDRRVGISGYLETWECPSCEYPTYCNEDEIVDPIEWGLWPKDKIMDKKLAEFM